jgi:hypothetical protein
VSMGFVPVCVCVCVCVCGGGGICFCGDGGDLMGNVLWWVGRLIVDVVRSS